MLSLLSIKQVELFYIKQIGVMTMTTLIGYRAKEDLINDIDLRRNEIFKSTGHRVTRQKLMEAILRANFNKIARREEHELTCRYCNNHMKTVNTSFKRVRVICTACENVNLFLNSYFQK